MTALDRQLDAVWLGRRPYAPVHQLQERLHALRRQGQVGDTVLLCEHAPVITLGRGSLTKHLLASEAVLENAGVDLVRIGRGGDVTLHAPGQLVCYPIIDLAPDRRDVRRYVGDLTRVMQQVCAEHGVAGGAFERYVGLWVDAADPTRWQGAEHAVRPAKVGAIGVRISRWVTMHGFALNLSTDLSQFALIVPCGIADYPVTSLLALTGGAPPVRDAAARALFHLAEVLGARVRRYADLSVGELQPERMYVD